MRTPNRFIVVSTLVLTTACARHATTVRTTETAPGATTASETSITVTPQRGQTADQQTADIRDCENVAQNTSGSRGTETAKGAGAGAAIGALGGAAAGAAIGAATGGNPGTSAGIGAGAGAATGAATGGVYKYRSTNADYNAALRSCLTQRGYGISG
jgi:outer membrane lipoprotein SlyB